MLSRLLPFVTLGIIGVFGVVAAAQAADGAPPAKKRPVSDAGSVEVEAQLERTKLLAGERGETYARILLRGKDAPAPTARLPVALTLVVDVSGSMRGEKIRNARESAIAAIEQLSETDRYSVVTFSSGATTIIRSAERRAGMDEARRLLSALSAGGGTDMVAALEEGHRVAQTMRRGTSQTNRVMLLSDGQPNTSQGLTEKVDVMVQDGVLTTTIGIGRDYNEDLMASLADHGLGNYYFVEHPTQMAKIFQAEVKDLATVVGKEAVVTIALKNGVKVEEVYGFPTSVGMDVVAINVGDVFANRKIDILARLSVPATSGEKELIDVKVTYHDALDNAAKRVNERLAAVFTSDQAAVTASLVKDVADKTQKIRTARAMEEATAAYEKGDRGQARQIIEQQKMSNAVFGGSAGGAYAASQAQLNDDLDALTQEAEAPAADYSVVRKRSKASARSMRRR